MKTSIRILLAIVLVIVGVFGAIVGGAFAINDEESSTNWSDLEVIKSLYEEMIEAEDPEAFFEGLPLEAQKALAEAILKPSKVTVTVTGESSR
ncbi:MAG: hypothetical protein V3T73_00010 [Dehalococcoidales bacterium]|jgi:hypothetical protein